MAIINQMELPDVDTSQPPVPIPDPSGVYYNFFGANAGSLYIWKDDGSGTLAWLTPATQEIIENVPKYNMNVNDHFETMSNSLGQIVDFHLLGNLVYKIECENVDYYETQHFTKPLNDYQVTIASGQFLPNTKHYIYTYKQN